MNTTDNDVTTDQDSSADQGVEDTQGNTEEGNDSTVVTTPPKPPAGFVPKGALDEERNKRKRLEEELAQLKTGNTSSDDDFDGDQGLKKELDSIKSDLSVIKSTSEKERVYAQFPVLKDKAQEFDDYIADYPGIALEKVARLFISEYGLNEARPQRKGLEKTSSTRQATAGGMSADEVKNLRENFPRRYMKMIADGKIKPEDIKA